MPCLCHGSEHLDRSERLSDEFDILKKESYENLSFDGKRSLDRAVRAFNTNPKRGIRYILKESQLASDLPTLGKFLANVNGLNKDMLGEWLGEHHEENVSTLDYFSNAFPFEDMSFDSALRLFLTSFRLPGEAQKIDRITYSFAKAYHGKNPLLLSSVDVVHILSFSAILLNTDAHRPGIKNRMTLEQFISNNRGIDDGNDIPRSILEELYHGIVKNEIITTKDRSDEGNLFTYPVKEGWLSKKGGFRSKVFQKRYFILCEGALFYFKDEEDINPRGFFALVDNAKAMICPKNARYIRLLPQNSERNESHEIKSAKFNKKGTLVTGNHKEATLLAGSVEDAEEWVNVINEAAKKVDIDKSESMTRNESMVKDLQAQANRRASERKSQCHFDLKASEPWDTSNHAIEKGDDPFIDQGPEPCEDEEDPALIHEMPERSNDCFSSIPGFFNCY